MIVAGVVMICGQNPLWPVILEHNMFAWDKMCIMIDGIVGSEKQISSEVLRINGKHGPLEKLVVSHKPWTYHWRGKLLRMLDDIKPDIFVLPDDDEAMPRNQRDDAEILFRSDHHKEMKFHIDEPTIDGQGAFGKSFKLEPHVKIFRWREGLAFNPGYPGCGQTATYKNCQPMYSINKTMHYAVWSKAIADKHIRGPAEKEK